MPYAALASPDPNITLQWLAIGGTGGFVIVASVIGGGQIEQVAACFAAGSGGWNPAAVIPGDWAPADSPGPSTLSYQLVGLDFAQNIELSITVTAGQIEDVTLSISGPNVGVPGTPSANIATRTVDFTELTEAVNGTPQTFAFDIGSGQFLPPFAFAVAYTIVVDTEFSGGGLTAITADFGDGVDPNGYFALEDVFTGSGVGPRTIPSTLGALLVGASSDVAEAPRTPNITLTPDVGHNLAAVTAGELEAMVVYLQVGGP